MTGRATVRLVTHRCPSCGVEVGATPSSVVEHRCPKSGRKQRFKVDAQASETGGTK